MGPRSALPWLTLTEPWSQHGIVLLFAGVLSLNPVHGSGQQVLLSALGRRANESPEVGGDPGKAGVEPE